MASSDRMQALGVCLRRRGRQPRRGRVGREARSRGFAAKGFGTTDVKPARGFGAPSAKPALEPPTEQEIQALESAVAAALEHHGTALVRGLREHGWWASEGPVLPKNSLAALRAEVEALWAEGFFNKSQSVRGTQYYDKQHVFALEVDGRKYNTAPRLVHYTVSATRAVAARIRAAFPEVPLSQKYIGNKLNLCVGQGASFDAHLDIGVAEKPFNRKLTLLIYFNDWRKELGGELSLLGEGATEEAAAVDTGRAAAGLPTLLAPSSGRWVAFWSDRMLHGVNASHAPAGLPDYRASYTIWFCTQEDTTPGTAAARVAAASEGAYEAPRSFSRF